MAEKKVVAVVHGAADVAEGRRAAADEWHGRDRHARPRTQPLIRSNMNGERRSSIHNNMNGEQHR